jgi:hypothetical protein
MEVIDTNLDVICGNFRAQLVVEMMPVHVRCGPMIFLQCSMVEMAFDL